jgi:hypothetical protein
MSDDQSADDAAEIDLGRYVGRVLARWYIVVACVVLAVVIAYIGQSSNKTYTAKALIYLGQPFTPNNSNNPIPISLSTNPLTPGILIKQQAVIDAAAAKAHIDPAQLAGSISVQGQLPANSRSAFTTLNLIIVQGPWGKRTAIASNELARQIILHATTYQTKQAAIQRGLVSKEQAQLDVLTKRDKLALAQLTAARRSTAGSRIERFLVVQNVINALGQIESRIGALTSSLANDQQTALALSPDVAGGRIVTPAIAAQTTAGSKRASYAIAVIVGLIVGIALALLSYSLPSRKTA